MFVSSSLLLLLLLLLFGWCFVIVLFTPVLSRAAALIEPLPGTLVLLLVHVLFSSLESVCFDRSFNKSISGAFKGTIMYRLSHIIRTYPFIYLSYLRYYYIYSNHIHLISELSFLILHSYGYFWVTPIR